MSLFGRPSVDDLAARLDLKGLCKALGDRDPAVRKAAAAAFETKEVLGKLEQERNMARFDTLLERVDDPPVREKIIATLIRVLRTDVAEQFGYTLGAFQQATAGKAVVAGSVLTSASASALQEYERRIHHELSLLEGLGAEVVDPLRNVLGDELLAPYAVPILARIEKREAEALAVRA